MTMTAALRSIYRHNSNGYEMLLDPDASNAESGALMHHRAIAYAHGELSDPWEPVEVDHLTPIEWLNHIDNLDAVSPIEHGRRTRQRERQRGAEGGSA